MKEFFGNEKYKKLVIAFWVSLTIAVVTFVVLFIMFSQRLKNTSDIGLLSVNTINNVVPNNSVNTKVVSSSEDRNINEVANEILNDISSNNTVLNEKQTNSLSSDKKDNTVEAKKVSKNESSNTLNTVQTSKEDEKKEIKEEVKEEIKPIDFIAPVSGDILTDYAEDSLIYSSTLEEWTTHLGIDIKANKASSVVSAEDGTIKSIKSDPRYGLTITISHRDGYETVYSNLLGAEFVNEGDTVQKGQTIGTVGESASFEVAEVPHLHFEIYKDGKNVNPTMYLQ